MLVLRTLYSLITNIGCWDSGDGRGPATRGAPRSPYTAGLDVGTGGGTFATRTLLNGGTATVPSSIELYVNQALVQRTMVDTGPFARRAGRGRGELHRYDRGDRELLRHT